MGQRCANCQRPFRHNPRIKKQDYCSRPECQRARKRKWQREKLKKDPDYRKTQKVCNQAWKAKNPDYWKRYRTSHPSYANRNRKLQRLRNKKRKERLQKWTRQPIAKMDASNSDFMINTGKYLLIPLLRGRIAKMDALPVQLSIISTF